MPYCSNCGSREYYCSRCGGLEHCNCNSTLSFHSLHKCRTSVTLVGFNEDKYCSKCGASYPSKQYCTRCGANITPMHTCRKSGDLSYFDLIGSPKHHICSDSLI